MIMRALENGLGEKLLISHDLGWYDPAQPGGGTPRPYTHLVESLLPSLKVAGASQDAIRQLTEVNPFEAFAR
jgi:phosphotriesterase-related protein